MINTKLLKVAYLGFFVVPLFISCNKTEDIIEMKAPMAPTTVLGRASAMDHPGRTLSANCFQCHGTNGYAGELKIAGMGYSELVSKLTSYRTRDPKLDIMYFHAQAYTDTEINLIADYFSKQ